MKQATRKWLKLRPQAQYIGRVKHTPVEGKVPNQCQQNSYGEVHTNNAKWVAGWVIGDYSKEHDQSPVIFHFWNVDKNGNWYDTSPGMDAQNFEYVYDMDVADVPYNMCKKYGNKNLYFPPAIKIKSNSVMVNLDSGKKMTYDWLPIDPDTPIDLEELMTKVHKLNHSKGRESLFSDQKEEA